MVCARVRDRWTVLLELGLLPGEPAFLWEADPGSCSVAGLDDDELSLRAFDFLIHLPSTGCLNC